MTGMPGTNGTISIEASNIMQPDLANQTFIPQTFTALFVTNFRECIKGEIYFPNQKFYECYPCPDSKYSLVIPILNSDQQICKPCPFESANRCFSNNIQLRQGFWRKNLDQDLIIECENLKENCVGGLQAGDQSCYEGHIGALCEGCDIEGKIWDTSYSISSKYSCTKCSDIKYNAILIVLSFLYTLASIGLSVKSGIQEQQEEFIKDQRVVPIQKTVIENQNNKPKNNSKQNEGTIYIKILTNYLQIISSISSFQLSFSTSYLQASNTVGQPISQSMNSLECFLQQYFGQYEMIMIYKRLILSLSLALIYFLLFQLVFAIYSVIKKQKYEFFIIITSFNFLILFLQPDLVSYMISILSCRHIGDTYYILGNVIHECFTSQYMYYSLLLVFPFLLLWVVFLPLIQIYQLWKSRLQLKSPLVLLKFGFLYKEYRLNRYYWEFMKMYQKILIILVLNYYSQDIKTKGILIFAIIVMYALTVFAQRPYRKNYFTDIDTQTSKICATTILTAVFISQIPYDYFFIIGIIIIVYINITFIIRLLWLIISCYVPMLVNKVDLIKIKLMKRYPALQYFIQVSRTRRLKQAWKKFTATAILSSKSKANKLSIEDKSNNEKKDNSYTINDLTNQQLEPKTPLNLSQCQIIQKKNRKNDDESSVNIQQDNESMIPANQQNQQIIDLDQGISK